MLATVRDVLVDPNGYFGENTTEPRLLLPVAVVVAYAAFSSAVYLPILLHFDGNLTQILTYALFDVFLVNGAMAVIGWFLLAVTCQILSYVLDGSGSFRRTLPLIGWGFLPLIVGHVGMLIATSIAVQGAPSMSVESSQQMALAAESLMDGQAVQIAVYVSTVLYLWSCYIWVFVLKHTRDLSLSLAVVSVVIPVMLLNMFGLM